jgi:serine/threonine-protein phosphatase 2B regulatory subunit
MIITSNFIVSALEIDRLYRRFQRLDRNDSGTISVSEFMSIPELAMNPLSPRIISVIVGSSLRVDEITFRDFIGALSVFHVRASREEKLQFAFKVFDVKQDGIVDRDEIHSVLKSMVGQFLVHYN